MKIKKKKNIKYLKQKKKKKKKKKKTWQSRAFIFLSLGTIKTISSAKKDYYNIFFITILTPFLSQLFKNIINE